MLRQKAFAFTWIDLLIVLVVIAVMVALLFPWESVPKEAGRRAVCMNNLSEIALAMINYHDKYDTFPPAYVADKEGKPLYSWRVLILPWMECRNLYDEFRLDEPWDSEANLKLLDRMPSFYRCPSNKNNMLGSHTSYVRIVGPGTVTDGPTAVAAGEIADGTSKTILVTETLEDVPWTAPIDIPFEKLDLGVNSKSGRGLGSKHPGVVIAAFADRSVQVIGERTKPETLRALATVAGNETVAEGDY